jgi:AcrR family transcriptional regulator
VLTSDQIIEAAEDVLRRFGPGKATVVDVARALGVSHGSVYRHFPSKASLRSAVTERWLERSHVGLAELAAGEEPPPERLRSWLATLFAAKRRKALDDPQLFATYSTLASEASDVVAEHVARMIGQLERIVADGIASGDFDVTDAHASADAAWTATDRFHNPVHAGDWGGAEIDASFDAVVELVLRGLGARVAVLERPAA